ncbi:RNA-guided endonuclease TnpB family protein [Secundilactobacillus muriivasis]
MVLQAFQVRLYPNATQKQLIHMTFGSTRFVWNQMLNMLIERYRNNPECRFLSTYDRDALLPALKREYPWLKLVDSTALQRVNRDLTDAYKRFFDKTLANRFPRFKSKRNNHKSYTSKFVGKNIEVIDQHHLKLPKLGKVYFRAGRILNGKIHTVTVRINPQGQYSATILLECEDPIPLPLTHQRVGLDLGLKQLITLSNGTSVPLTQYDRELARRLRRWERKLARRLRNAKQAMAEDRHNKVLNPRTELWQFPRYQQARKTVAKIKRQIAARRLDNLQKLTTQLVREYDVLVVEKLSVKNLMKNHRLARSIANAAWGTLVRLLTYKFEWAGKQLIIVNPKNTSRICHVCQQKNTDFDGLSTHEWLAVRDWQCPNCQTTLDRDINAALNIKQRGLALVD